MSERVFCYQVGDYWVMLEAGVKPELLAKSQVYPLPFAPDWCLGLTAVHGELLPVVDMHAVFFREQKAAQVYWLCLRQDGMPPLVLGCDSLPKQVVLAEDTEREGAQGLPGWVSWICRQDGHLLLAADHKRLLRLLQQRAASSKPQAA